MSKNCLEIRYKTTVNNDSLEYFNALQFKADWSSMSSKYYTLFTNSVIRLGGVGVKVVILSNGEIRNTSASAGTGVQEYVIPSDLTTATTMSICPLDNTKMTEFLLVGLTSITSIYFPDSNTKIALRNPTVLKKCINLNPFERSAGNVEIPVFLPYSDFDGYDISEYLANYSNKANVTIIKQYSNVTGSSTKVYSGTSAYTGYTNLKETNRGLGIDYGNISDFGNLTNITTLAIGVTNSVRGVEGDISSLAKLTSATVVSLNNSKVKGTIEEFAAAQYGQGRKSASRIRIFSSIVTYLDNGVPTVIGGGGKYVSWSDGGSAPTNITVTAS